jgi:alkanesulfonate monooxygenase SsuD/methylene tetrahydromethanopterin reductase-like flavin-dependent oxidoreductase (luciferase family)
MSRPHRQIPTRVRLAALLALGVASALGGPPALAQTAEELAAARQVFGEGKALEGKAQWAEALEKFKKVAMVKMTPQVRFHIALCEENLGRFVSAIKGFELASEEARSAGSSAAEVEKLAPERAAALRGRVGKLRLEVSGKLIDSRVLLDDAPVAARELGTDILVDPGAHVVEVRDRDGKSTFKQDVTVAEKGAARIELSLDDKDPADNQPPPPPPPPPPPSRAPVYVAGGLGAAAFAVSAVFFAMRGNTIDQAVDAGHCKPDFTGCDRSAKGRIDELTNQGRTDMIVSGVFLGVGIAGAATALGFLIVPLARKAPAQTTAAPKTSLTISPTGTGLLLRGTF